MPAGARERGRQVEQGNGEPVVGEGGPATSTRAGDGALSSAHGQHGERSSSIWALGGTWQEVVLCSCTAPASASLLALLLC